MIFSTFPISGEVYLAGYFVALALSFGLTLTPDKYHKGFQLSHVSVEPPSHFSGEKRQPFWRDFGHPLVPDNTLASFISGHGGRTQHQPFHCTNPGGGADVFIGHLR